MPPSYKFSAVTDDIYTLEHMHFFKFDMEIIFTFLFLSQMPW